MKTSKMFVLFVPFVLFGLLAGQGLVGQSIQLRDGTVLVGKVEDASDNGFSFKRLDSGGVLRLRWDHLTPRSSNIIKTREGLLVEEDERVTVNADVIIYLPAEGARKQEVIGKIVKQDDERIYLRRRGSDIPIRRITIRGRSTREVEPTEIYTPNEYYQSVKPQFNVQDNADGHIDLAVHLMKVRDYDHAKVHLDKATELDNSKQPEMLKQMHERLAILKENAAEQQLLDEIRMWLNRGNFKIALEKIEGFKTNYPSSKLQAQFERLVGRVGKAREAHLVRRVTKAWYKAINTLAKSKAGDKKVGLQQAREYAQSQMGKEIRSRLAKAFELTESEVDEFWTKRLEHRGVARPSKYHYSVGSWLLGRDAIIKDTKLAQEQKTDDKGKSKREQELERQIKRIREAIERARRGGGGGGAQKGKQQVTPATWWQGAERDQRYTWIKALYAEQSGDLEVTAAYLDNCLNCGASGFVTQLGSAGKSTKVKCSVCQGTQFKRVFRAR